MILSTILRVTRNAARAAAKSGKKLVNGVASTRRTVSGETTDGNVKSNDTLMNKFKTKNKKLRKLKSMKKVGKSSKKVASNLFILAVGFVEDILSLLFGSALIFMLILCTLIPVLAVVIMGTIDGVSSISTSGGNFTTTGESGGVQITDPSTYDWWGNKEQNMRLLTDDYDKELYQLIMMNMDLAQYSHSDTSVDNLWNGTFGVGILYAEMGGGISSKIVNFHEGTEAEKNQLKYEKWNYVFAPFCLGYSSDYRGDGPVGLSWGLPKKDVSYEYSHYEIKNVNKKWLDDSATGTSGYHGTYNDNQKYAIWTTPGSLKWSYYNTIAYSYTDWRTEAFDRWGVEKSDENLYNIATCDYYAKHHGHAAGNKDEKAVLEYMLALYNYVDKDLNNVYIVDSSGKLAKDEGHAIYREVLANDFGKASSNYIKVIHDGKEHTFKGSGDDLLGKALLDWAKSENPSGYKKLKEAIDYGSDGAPGFNGNTLFSSNVSNCIGIYLIGSTLVKYMVEKLGLTFDVATTDNSNFPGGTQTAKNVVAVMTDLYNKHGAKSSDKWTMGYNQLLNSNGSKATNFNTEWCAMFVNTVLNTAKINGSTKTVAQGLHDVTNDLFPSGACAEMGYGNSRKYDSLFTSTSGLSNRAEITKSGYVTAHYGGQELSGKNATKDYKGEISKESLYKPKAGDIIVFSFGNHEFYDHVGMVREDSESFYTVNTIEGNTNDDNENYGAGGWLNTRGYSNSTSICMYLEINYLALEEKFGTPSIKTGGSGGKLDINKYVETQAKTLGNDSTLSGCSQVLDVVTSGTSAKLTVYNKSNGKWTKGGLVDASGFIGKDGVGSKDSNANESCSKTPFGAYYLGVNFGGFGIAQSGLKIDWKNVSSKQSYWGSSNNSKHLNKFYQASSAETSADENLTSICNSGAYKYSILIEYNYGNNAKKGGGSAFFLHVGSNPTAGCVATSESNMKKIVDWIDKSKKTRILIHPEDSKVIAAATVSTGGSSSKGNSSTDDSLPKPLNYSASKLKIWGRPTATNKNVPEDVRKFCAALGKTSVCDTYKSPATGETIKQDGSFSFYTELTSDALDIPGRTHADGFVVDGDGYIVLAGSPNQKKNHTVVPTPFAGRKGKVYDVCGTSAFDIYMARGS